MFGKVFGGFKASKFNGMVDTLFNKFDQELAEANVAFNAKVAEAVEHAFEDATVNDFGEIMVYVPLDVVHNETNVVQAMNLPRKHTYTLDGGKVWKVKRDRYILIYPAAKDVCVFISKHKILTIPY